MPPHSFFSQHYLTRGISSSSVSLAHARSLALRFIAVSQPHTFPLMDRLFYAPTHPHTHWLFRKHRKVVPAMHFDPATRQLLQESLPEGEVGACVHACTLRMCGYVCV